MENKDKTIDGKNTVISAMRHCMIERENFITKILTENHNLSSENEALKRHIKYYEKVIFKMSKPTKQ